MTFILLLTYNVRFRYAIYFFINDICENGYIYFYILISIIFITGSIKGAFLIGFIGYILALTGFTLVFFDIIVGYLIRPYWYALLIVFLG